MTNIKLVNFNQEYYKTLPDYQKIGIQKNGKYHTIIFNEENAGIIGYIPVKLQHDFGFIQIIIEPKFRGMGLLKEAEDLLAKEYHLKALLATIDVDNIASIKSHQRAGFKMLKKSIINQLKKKGFLKENQIRMIKVYDR